VSRKTEEIVLEEFGVETVYEVLAILEFTSARRRMSVIVRNPEGKIILFCKGADIVIYDRLIEGDDDLKQQTTEDLKNFRQLFSSNCHIKLVLFLIIARMV
jgi:phospholipid-translocating ATPase